MHPRLQERRKWLARPTRKQVRTALLVYVVGNVLQLLALTGFEPSRLFGTKLYPFWATLLLSTWILLRMLRNYRRNLSQAQQQAAEPGTGPHP